MKHSFQNLIDYWGERTPNKEAIFDGHRRLSYRNLSMAIQALSSSLSLLNVQKGDKVMIITPNCFESIVIFFALAKLGAIVIPCNCAIDGTELKARLKKIDPKASFVADNHHLEFLKQNVPCCKNFTVQFKHDGYLSYPELIEKGKNREIKPMEIIPNKDVFTIMFTSGSTGCPKGVELTFHNLLKAAKNIGYRLRCTNNDIFLIPLPWSHMFGLITGILLPFYFGGKVILMEKYSPEGALDLIEKEKITVHHGVPTMFIRELERYKYYKKNISSLRTGIIAGAACPEKIVRQIYSEFHFDIMVAYGSTETVSVSMTSFEDDFEKRFQTVGRAFDGVKIKVVDDNGMLVEPGVAGELIVKGYGVMKDYYQMPNETKKVIDKNGWFHTGDIVIVDLEGYIKVVGRKKDLIIRGGNNITPAEVEGIYYHHPSILEICVLGIPNQELGEQTCAFLKLKKNSKDTQESLRKYALGKIAKYKVPDRIIVLENIPKLANGKINKQALLDYYSRLVSTV